MEQTLYWHPAWEKTISIEDRKHVEKLFTCTPRKPYTVFRVAINHKGELLVSALIQNEDQTPWIRQMLAFVQDSKPIAKGHFHVHVLPKTSMAWTFIFSDYGGLTKSDSGHLQEMTVGTLDLL
ncbi:hypothetical protein JCM19037_2667 [Geomicrobium sp. JCM 19037]|uniref:hypothetical protein n=1 Tax=unclassified Geomicrobium TaxID=2628951 RepID=UPI00045F2B45|nr:hypothetical protein [Geomicrobium sp. JCM 19037]GAK04278.1 hypothetical protein JCM19037_2667 [Geomicrobium sp. JCM 19037]